MAKVHGKGVVYTLDGESLSQYGTSITFTQTADSHDVTTFGATAHAYQAGLTDGTASLEGIYDDTGSTGPAAVLEPLVGEAAVELVYRPAGTGSGKAERTVQVIVTSFEESAPVADMITWTAELQFAGPVDPTAQAA